jgi:hypothetical protein
VLLVAAVVDLDERGDPHGALGEGVLVHLPHHGEDLVEVAG